MNDENNETFDDSMEDDLDEAFKEDSEDDTEDSSGEQKGEEEEKDSSAIIQKKKWRDKANDAISKLTQKEQEIKDLQDKLGKEGLSEEEKKDLAAKEFIADIVRDEISKDKQKSEEAKAKAEAEFDEQIADAMEENPNIKEDEIRVACKDYGVSPDSAVKIINKLAEKKKPNLPNPNKGSGEVETLKNKDGKPLSIDEAAAEAKKKIRQGEYNK